MLNKISKKDLVFIDAPMRDRTNTYIELNDYDWMQYIIHTEFFLKNKNLDVQFEYVGDNLSFMEVVEKKIIKNNASWSVYNYSFDSEIFKKYIIQFLKLHIESWESRYAFYGEDIVINFYNEVLKFGKLESDD